MGTPFNTNSRAAAAPLMPPPRIKTGRSSMPPTYASPGRFAYGRPRLSPEFCCLSLQRRDLLLQAPHLARLVVLPLRPSQLLLQKLQLLLDDFQPLFCF